MIKKIIGIALVISIITSLNTQIIFPISIGKLLSPFTGYVALINSDNLPNGLSVKI